MKIVRIGCHFHTSIYRLVLWWQLMSHRCFSSSCWRTLIAKRCDRPTHSYQNFRYSSETKTNESIRKGKSASTVLLSVGEQGHVKQTTTVQSLDLFFLFFYNFRWIYSANGESGQFVTKSSLCIFYINNNNSIVRETEFIVFSEFDSYYYLVVFFSSSKYGSANFIQKNRMRSIFDFDDHNWIICTVNYLLSPINPSASSPSAFIDHEDKIS